MLKKIIIHTFFFISFISFFIADTYAKNLSRPNIVLITLDALRPDHLSCYGYERKTSPNIDRLAEEGILFTQAIAQSSHTYCSIPSIIFSRYLPFYEINFNVDSEIRYRVKKNVTSLIEILRDSGYTVGLFLRKSGNLFSIYLGVSAYANEIVIALNNRCKDSESLTHWALKFIERSKNTPFFIWIFYYPPHAPYIPPPYLQDLFIGDSIYKKQIKEYDMLSISSEMYHSFGREIPMEAYLEPHKEYAYYIAQYDGYIRYIDELIGRIINELKKLNLYKDTLIIINSDHGELMGEHGRYFCHGELLYEPLIKVPLIMRYKSFPQGEKISTQIELIDLVPTILDILDISIPETFQGESFLDVILGKRNKHKKYAFSILEDYRISLRTSKYKLIKNIRSTPFEEKLNLKPPKYELYNIQNDSLEINNVSQKYPEIVKEFEKVLKEFMEKITFEEETRKEDTVRELERLKSLGYVQ